jgi:hypothetical protein
LKIKQNHTVYIYDRKLPRKSFLLSVEDEFYTFDVNNDHFVVLIIVVDSLSYTTKLPSFFVEPL